MDGHRPGEGEVVLCHGGALVGEQRGGPALASRAEGGGGRPAHLLGKVVDRVGRRREQRLQDRLPCGVLQVLLGQVLDDGADPGTLVGDPAHPVVAHVLGPGGPVDGDHPAVPDLRDRGMVQGHELPVAAEGRRARGAFERVGLVVQEAFVEDVDQPVLGDGVLLGAALRVLDDVDRLPDQDLGGGLDQRDDPELVEVAPVEGAWLDRDQREVQTLVAEEERVRLELEQDALLRSLVGALEEEVGGLTDGIAGTREDMVVGQEQTRGHEEAGRIPFGLDAGTRQVDEPCHGPAGGPCGVAGRERHVVERGTHLALDAERQHAPPAQLARLGQACLAGAEARLPLG